jgi:hypothetical protein
MKIAGCATKKYSIGLFVKTDGCAIISKMGGGKMFQNRYKLSSGWGWVSGFVCQLKRAQKLTRHTG